MNFKSSLDDLRKDPRWCGLLVGGLRTGEPRYSIPVIGCGYRPRLMLRRFTSNLMN